MLININTLRERIHGVILNKGEQGHNIEGLENKLESINDSYDALIKFAESLHVLPIRNDWPYVEPNGIEEIQSESDPTRHLGPIKTIDFEESSNRVKAAFLGSISGCILGKPLEASLTGNEIKSALEALTQSSMKLGEAMYKEQQAAAGASESNQEDGQPKDENVVDADFEEVKEDSKQA